MDAQRFDTMTRKLVDSASRRSLAKAAAAAALGTLFAGSARRTEAATCSLVGGVCDRSHRCCPNAVCSQGRCRCARPYANCRGLCQNLKLSEEHCGACGHTCARNEFCRMGTCCQMPNGVDPIGD